MGTSKHFGTGAVVALGIAALSAFGIKSAHAGFDGVCTVNANRCSVVCTDSSDSCTMDGGAIVCNGESLGSLSDSCAFWSFQMKRDNDFVCVQDTNLSASSSKLSLPIKTGLGTDTVCVGGVTVGDGSTSGGWMTIRSENGDDNIDVGDCSCNGAVGDTEVYGLATIATGRGNDTVVVDDATFHSDVSIRVGSGADSVTVSDATLDSDLEILAGTNPENTDVDTISIGNDVDVDGEVLIRTGGGNDPVTIDGADFADEVEIYAGFGDSDAVILDNIFCEGTNLPIRVDCGADGGTLCVGAGVDTSCGFGDTDCCDVINVNSDCTIVGGC